MRTTLDVYTEVYSLNGNQDVISMKGQMPSFFSCGDRLRSYRVDLYGTKLGVLVYPKGSRKSGDGLMQVYLRNYTELPRIFNMCVSFRDQDKKAENVILGGRRCIFIGDFDSPKEHEGHSPYIAIKLTLSVQGGWRGRSVIEGAQDELRAMLQSERKEGVEQIKEVVRCMREERDRNEAELKGLVKEMKEELQEIKGQMKKKLPECICCMAELSFPKRIVQCCRGRQHILSSQKTIKSSSVNIFFIKLKNYISLGHKVCEECSKRTVNDKPAGCPMRCGTGWMGRDYGLEDYLERAATNQVFFPLLISNIRNLLRRTPPEKSCLEKTKTISYQ